MRNRFAGLAVVALALVFSAAPRAGQAPRTAAAQKLPPLSYVCPMPGDEDVIEDKPGSCPKCKMDLVPVRLDSKWWCPVHQANEVYDGPGKCRRDGRELVQVTVSEFWTCADAPDKKNLEPGKCADGSARKIGYELRAHGDHNPRHGGQFFMATDAWHHVEGTYPQNGLLRVFFYDNFTKPLPVRGKGIAGSVVVRDARDKEVASAPLAIGRNTSTMEAKIPAATATLPLRVTVKLKFSATMAEQPFDFQFNELTKDAAPAGTAIGPTATPRPTAAPAAPKAPAPTVAAATPPATTPSSSATPSAAPASQSQPSSQASAGPTDLFAGEIAPMPPALAAALNEEVLPKGVPELIAELNTRSGQIDALMKEGNLSEVWLPAMGTKTVALVLEQHAGALPVARRALVTSAVKRVVTSAWEIDGYGDLGNRTKIVEAYQRMAAAVADLKAAYESSR
ncbi:MAG TPA: heavy metal-binding domain-containing protein [Vicinamibacterales bacterium]|nr:heavy metal-binding domain-containing protein [Vicinamibacterales bacterium]